MLFQTRASPASFEIRVMEDVPDDGACKGRYRSRILIVQSFGANARGSKSTWPRIAIYPSSAAPARPLWLPESPIREDPHQLDARSRVPYFASTHVSDPASLKATFEKKIRAGLPSAVPRCSVETRSGPAFL